MKLTLDVAGTLLTQAPPLVPPGTNLPPVRPKFDSCLFVFLEKRISCRSLTADAALLLLAEASGFGFFQFETLFFFLFKSSEQSDSHPSTAHNNCDICGGVRIKKKRLLL